MSSEFADLLPVRMLNEFVYCPRLFYFEHVDGRWADNEFTVDGKRVHRRVDRFDDLLPDATPDGAAQRVGDAEAETVGDERPEISRSVSLSSERLGITAKLDLVATADDEAVPIDTKRGRPPENEHRAWEPERVQLMAQGLLLRDHGYRCTHGTIYYAQSKTRVDVPFTAELEAGTLDYIEKARTLARGARLPDPLVDSPKCNGCSLSGICLPDETMILREVPKDPAAPEARRLYPVRDDAIPLYVQEQGATVGKSNETLIVRKQKEEIAQIRLRDVSQLVLCGNVFVTTQTVQLLCEAAVPIVYLSMGHWFYGITNGIHLRNAYDRAAQFRHADDPARCLAFAKGVVSAKGANQRTLLRRNGGSAVGSAIDAMRLLLDNVPRATRIDEILGTEGMIARHYFESFQHLLHPRDFDAEWKFETRNRRPPVDPVNALLSFGYALLAKECTVALLAEGLDPWWGLYHKPRHGRPSLALDLMEEFRPLIVDSAVVTAINTGMVTASDLQRTSTACALKPGGRKSFIRAYEMRVEQVVSHPIFGYKCNWRQIIRLQARLLSRWLRGDVPEYVGMTTR
jgi:CRISPR-associated protein Cas1